jgi:hypothetical protein
MCNYDACQLQEMVQAFVPVNAIRANLFTETFRENKNHFERKIKNSIFLLFQTMHNKFALKHLNLR